VIVFGMEIFQKVHTGTMFVSFGVAWLLVRLSMSFIVCDNVRSVTHLHGKSQEAYDQYFSEITPVCHFWQDVVDSSFTLYPLPFQSAVIYSALLVLLAVCIEVLWVYFQKEKYPINDKTNDWRVFLIIRSGWFFAYVFISMSNTFH
jgi:hypothetical protein